MNRPHPDLGARRAPPADALGTALWLSAHGLWPVPITPPDDGVSPNPGKAPIGRRWPAFVLCLTGDSCPPRDQCVSIMRTQIM